jgi:serine/threonine protein kinase
VISPSRNGRGFDAENDTMTEYVQTRWYRAPELLCDSSHYGRVSEQWTNAMLTENTPDHLSPHLFSLPRSLSTSLTLSLSLCLSLSLSEQPVDIWSVGCIFAELLTHEAFFRVRPPLHRLSGPSSSQPCCRERTHRINWKSLSSN